MLKKIENLPSGVLGVQGIGQVTRTDYETVLIPLLEEEHRRGRNIRFLYQFGPEFSGFTAGAAMDDFRVGLKYLKLFERCAVVSDTEWIRGTTQFVGSFMPCPVLAFKNDELESAIEWLASPVPESNLKVDMRGDGVLIIRPQGPLAKEDFYKLASIVDPWVEAHHKLHGLVICIQKFPGWENVGSFIDHIEFVKAHQRKVRRVAVAMDGVFPEMMSRIAGHFIEAKIKQFPFSQVEDAIQWVRDQT